MTAPATGSSGRGPDRGPSSMNGSGLGLSLLIDHRLGELGERLIGRLFLVKRLLEELRGVAQVELLGPGAQRAIAGNLVMLDRLRRRDKTGIERGRALELLDDFLALVEDAFDGRALFALRLFFDQFEHLLKTLDLTFGFAMMLFKRRAEIIILRSFRHLRQRAQDLLLSVIDVFQRVVE